jgi:hypothetical protein
MRTGSLAFDWPEVKVDDTLNTLFEDVAIGFSETLSYVHRGLGFQRAFASI